MFNLEEAASVSLFSGGRIARETEAATDLLLIKAQTNKGTVVAMVEKEITAILARNLVLNRFLRQVLQRGIHMAT